MADKKEKIVIGRGNVRAANWMQATISEKSLLYLLENLQSFNEHKYVKLNINIAKDPKPDKFGKVKDVEISLDTWQPSGNYARKEPVTIADEIKQLANDTTQPSPAVELPF